MPVLRALQCQSLPISGRMATKDTPDNTKCIARLHLGYKAYTKESAEYIGSYSNRQTWEGLFVRSDALFSIYCVEV